MDTMRKLEILADSAKYDVACTSSGVTRRGDGGLGNTIDKGICHSFSADGRCISLLKVLFTNHCEYDCSYCVNRSSNDVPRAAFTPRELAELTISFYRRNYIEGLFLSSGVVKNPNHTTELMIEALRILREEYRFGGYIHAKAIPGTDDALVYALGLLADRMSVNIELPSETSLGTLAPQKTRNAILRPMGLIGGEIKQSTHALTKYKHAPQFVPAGQSTQMIIGASGESDHQILNLTQGLYRRYSLKRVFFSAYVPVVESKLLPALGTPPPLLREHRLYQADWLLRFYDFEAEEILSAEAPNFNPYLDPKCNWAIHNMAYFPVEVSTAPYNTLLRVPGIGPTSAKRIVAARRGGALNFELLKKMGVVLKRAKFFITCAGKSMEGGRVSAATAVRALLDPAAFAAGEEQLSFFNLPQITTHPEEALSCLLKAI